MAKKLISIVLIVVFVLGTVSTCYAEDKFMLSHYFNDIYDNHATGIQPSNTITNGNVIEVVEYPSATNKSLHFKGNTGCVAGFVNGSVDSADDIVISFDIRITDTGLNNSGKVSLAVFNLARTERNILYINDAGSLYSADGLFLARVGKTDGYRRVSVAIDIRTGEADVYLDGVKKTSNFSLGIDDYKDIGEVRLYMQGGEYNLDNFRVYSATEPVEVMEDRGVKIYSTKTIAKGGEAIAKDDDLAEYMGSSIVFYNGKNAYYKDGKKAQWTDGELYKLADGSGLLNGKFAEQVLRLDVAGQEFVDISTVSALLGKKLTLDKSGMAIIGDKEEFFTMTDDLPMFRAMAQKLVFENVSGAEMYKMFSSRFEAGQFPRLFADKDGFDRIKELAKTDVNMQKAFEKIIISADKQLEEPTIVMGYDNDNSLRAARDLRDASFFLGFAYQITGDTKYSDKLWTQLEAVSNFENWYPPHFLSTGEFIFAAALGYDWIYETLTDSQRALVEKAIEEKGLNPALEDYEDVEGRERTFKWVQAETCSNWKMVCDASVVAASSVLMEKNPEKMTKLLDYAMENIQQSILGYAPDGAWFEGTTYWNYATIFFGYFINILDSVYGSDFGYMDSPGIPETVDFMIAIQGDNGTFNYGDSNHMKIVIPEFCLFAKKLGKPGYQKYFLDHTVPNEPAFVFNYTPEWANTDDTVDVPLDFYARDVETVMFHSSYDENSIFTAMHSGDVTAAHGQYDSGEIIIDAYGTDFVFDLGSASYNLFPQDYLYRKRAEGHNVPVINPSYSPGQNKAAYTRITRFESNDGSALAITDLTDAYSKDAKKAVRGLMLTNSRETIVLQDEISLKEKGTIRWGLHSNCPITISDDGKTATFEGRYKNMVARLVSDCPAKFKVVPAAPISGVSPKVAGDTDDSNTNKLLLDMKDVKDVTVSVVFDFCFDGEKPAETYKLTKLDDWKLGASTMIEKPLLDTITVNGEEITGFDKSNKMYTYYYRSGENVPVLNAEGNGNIDIKYPDGGNGTALITVTDKENPELRSVYGIKLISKTLKKLKSGEEELFIYGITPGDVPQPENGPDNAIDGDLDTRYAALENPQITFDLGDVKTITHTGIAVWQGDEIDHRKQSFDVAVSNDGVDFTTIFSGVTSGTTLEQELYTLPETNARYIRIIGTAVDGQQGRWNSFTELTIYGK